MTNQPYPPFLYFNNDTNSLKFSPHSVWYQSHTYYFIIIVKEKYSDSVFYPYYCTVKVSGDKLDPEVYFNFTHIKFNMSSIDKFGRGSFTWSHPVNLKFIRDNWD